MPDAPIDIPGAPDGTPTTPEAIGFSLAGPVVVSGATAQVAFSCAAADCLVYCSLDGATAIACSSPWSANNLSEGSHTLVLFAAAAGQTATLTQTFAIVLAPTIVLPSGAPATLSNATSVDVTFACAGGEACAFSCTLNGGTAASCSSPFSVTSEGAHVLRLIATDPQGQSATLEVTFTIDRTPPQLVSAVFSGYQTLTLTYNEPLQAPVTSEFSLLPAKPAGMAVTAATLVSNATVELTLSKRHLPLRDYVASARVLDLIGNPQQHQVQFDIYAFQSRVGFITTATTDGNIAAYAEPCGGTSGLAKADCMCQSDADAAGFAGTYWAVLGDGSNSLTCRLRGIAGTSGACSTIPVEPYIRTDGEILSALFHNQGNSDGIWITNFMRADATTAETYGWYGTGCSDWASTTGNGSGTNKNVDELPGRIVPTWPCTETHHLHCLRIDGGGLALGLPPPPVSAKRAFVSLTPKPNVIVTAGAPTGVLSADAHCNAEATGAGLGGQFVAWLSDANNDAYCRAAGAVGKKGNNCNLATLPTVTSPYVTTLGLPVADNLDDWADGVIHYPFFSSALGGAAGWNLAWTGTTTGGVVSGNGTCSSWTANTTTNAAYPNNRTMWQDAGAGNCVVNRVLICLER